MKKKVSETDKNKRGSGYFADLQKRSEKALRESEEYFKEIIENSSDIVVVINKNGDIKYCTGSIERYSGYKPEELIGKSAFTFIHPDDIKRASENFERKIQAADFIYYNEYRLLHKDGSARYFEGTGKNLLNNPAIAGYIINGRDITERRKAEELLKESEAKYHLLADHVKDFIWTMDMNLRFTDASPSVERTSGYTADEIKELSPDKFLSEESFQKALIVFAEEISHAAKNKLPPDHKRSLDVEFRCKDGRIIWVDVTVSFIMDENDKPLYILGEGRDITERKNMAKKLRDEEQRFRTFAEQTSDIILLINKEGIITYENPASEKGLGYKLEEVNGSNILNYLHPDDLKPVEEIFDKFFEDRSTAAQRTELRLRDREGKWFMFEAVGSALVHDDVVEAVFVNLRNITERKQAEEKLRRSETKYRLLADNITDIIFTMDMNLRYTYASPSSYRLLGYTVDEALMMKIGKTVSSETLKLFADILFEELEMEKRDDRDLTRSRVIEYQHIRKDGSKIWVETTLTFLRDENNTAVGILGTVRDISKRKLSEIALADTMERLRKALGATVQVMASAVEMKDPYTAGHQKRTATLARDIATEMGLPRHVIEGIRMAGIIHDIGKLSIPSEILAKPSRLTNIEFSLIKEHSRSGYEMLKDVESPWPLARIVHQHHERMSGTGYPGNLKGDEIITEARVLAVADVVEAMASHRPYRASLGIEAALEEIEKNRGISYDADVVDACLRLFREKGYHLE